MRVGRCLAVGLVLLLGLAAAGGSAVMAQATAGCSADWDARFGPLHAALGSTMGSPTGCEAPDPDQLGDILQPTTTGLAFWRRSTGLSSFTDGDRHWSLTEAGLVTWSGASGDPPLHLNPQLSAADPDAWWMASAGEAHFEQAYALLEQWPEGHDLLREADQFAVAVRTARIADEGHFGTYRQRDHAVTVDLTSSGAPTWMVASILAHELRHASDFFNGIWVGETTLACIRTEQRAFQTERRFLTWLSYVNQPDGLPPPRPLVEALAPEHVALAIDEYALGLAPDLDAFAQTVYTTACQR